MTPRLRFGSTFSNKLRMDSPKTMGTPGMKRLSYQPFLVGDVEASLCTHSCHTQPAKAVAMLIDDLKRLANDVFRANSEAEMHRLLASLTAEEAEELAQLVEMGAMKAWIECERAKGRAG